LSLLPAPDPTTLDPAHLVGAGGALGALARHEVARRIGSRPFPFSTLVVNVLGTFALGLATFVGLDGSALLFVGTGACGAFTTFSSFAFETVRLWETGERARAAANALGNLVGAGAALGAAWLLAAALG